MQTNCRASVPLHRISARALQRVMLLAASLCCVASAAAGTPKVHTVGLGKTQRVHWTLPDAVSAGDSILRVRGLYVDGLRREWTTGEAHDVTDRTFTIRRALHLNDALPGEAPRWTWQPGPWLMVDRVSGRVTALHLPAFDAEVSDVVWFRDYAAYCGIATTAKGGLLAVVAELGRTKAVAERVVGKWPVSPAPHPACAAAQWQRLPMRVTITPENTPATTPAHAEAVTFDVFGTSSLVEEGESAETE